MTLNLQRCPDCLNAFAFKDLFIDELGWDRHAAQVVIEIDGRSYSLRAVAEKRGVQVFECRVEAGQDFPDYSTRKKIEKQLTKTAYEHLIIFTDAARTVQIWQWAARAPGQPDAYREHPHHPKTRSGDLLLQKLRTIRFTIDEEESVDIAGVTHKLRDAFDRDAVTKRFYNRFKEEHAAFLQFIQGLADQRDREWYASLMLNRLMFVWFIQQKGFLDGDTSYLQNRLDRVRQVKGRDNFHTFYRYFLLALFHQGFAREPVERQLDPELKALLGNVPYLNGGLFDPHQLETENQDLQIPDQAFARLFQFFGEYDWHLDTRTVRTGREINPDVLGYIFEKYINQKQMGAYYTKEDITEYIAKNTVIPYLFEAAEKNCAVAFQPGSALWRLLRENPDRYLYPAVRHGVVKPDGSIVPEAALPEFVQTGLHDPQARMHDRRYNLQPAPAGDPLRLVTETWREYAARRRRCLEVRAKLERGEIRDINDLITYNLNIRQFAQDAIAECEGPDLLRAFWQSLRQMTVLDPTCGSGAFLFAALEILRPLYEAGLTRMQAFVEDLDRSGQKHSPKKFSDFRQVLDEIARHPNRDYFILKSIIIHTLYGVDIMEEAVEICKLRLFLKLVAQVDAAEQIEPLPDIDFNIRAGNTLVGFTSLDEVKKAVEGDMLKGLELPEIEEKAEDAAEAFKIFHEMQTKQGLGSREFTEAKKTYRHKLAALGERLNEYLAGEYGVDPQNRTRYNQWLESHQPFHWLTEFYGIMQSGGFDVIIGNPPYVEWNKVRSYSVTEGQYHTFTTGNIYTLICERSYSLLGSSGYFGMIVPISCCATTRMQPLRDLWRDFRFTTHISLYSGDAHPSVLFYGVKFRLSILLQNFNKKKGQLFTTHFQRWYPEGREFLFSLIRYNLVKEKYIRNSLIPKISCYIHQKLFDNLCEKTKKLAYFVTKKSDHIIYCHRIVAHFVKAIDFIPYFCSERDGLKKSEDYKIFSVVSEDNQQALLSLLNSSLFYIWFVSFSDVYHCGREILFDFPVDLERLAENQRANLKNANIQLMNLLKANAIRRQINYKNTGLVKYDEFYPRLSKHINDAIDVLIAQHYGFTDEELDFIINYDIKYRMGLGGADGEE